MKRLAFLLIMLMTSVALAADPPHTTGPAHAGPDNQPHPALSADSTWGGIMVIVILMLFFLPAAVIGPAVRALTPPPPPEVHDDHGHDDHGHGHDDHGHGHGH